MNMQTIWDDRHASTCDDPAKRERTIKGQAQAVLQCLGKDNWSYIILIQQLIVCEERLLNGV